MVLTEDCVCAVDRSIVEILVSNLNGLNWIEHSSDGSIEMICDVSLVAVVLRRSAPIDRIKRETFRSMKMVWSL